MANMKNAKKKIKVSQKQKEMNHNYTASMRTAIKNTNKAVVAKDKEKAEENLKVAIKKIDKAKSANAIKANNAARNKSRLTKKVNAM